MGSVPLISERTTATMMHLQVRADLYSENSQHFGTTRNIQEIPPSSSIPDSKMVKLSMKRKRTTNNQISSEKKKVSKKDKSLNQPKQIFAKMSATELLQEIDNVLQTL